jgi:hypothetical protein
MKTARRWIVLAALCAGAAAHGADKACTKADAANAEKAIDRANTWPQLQKAWQDYRHCDADAVADVYTDAILRLAVDWKNVDAFAACMKDPQFNDFVITHMRSPAAKDDLDNVYSRAARSCPKGQEAFCTELTSALKPPASPPPTPPKQ